MSENKMMNNLIEIAKSEYCKKLEELSAGELHFVVGKAMMGDISDRWAAAKAKHASERRCYYLSAEFLMGRMIYNNMLCMGILEEIKDLLASKGIDINVFEEIDDAALGNGGLGRLAACFLDSAATQDVPLDGYGIRYKYGLFKQLIQDGRQVEVADDWQRFDDPWSIRREEDTVLVSFKNQTVKAVPYDMAVIGYGTENINTLRLWQAEAVEDFDFLAFNNCEYTKSVEAKNAAENISKVLYPNDNGYEGKVLRLKQQYFFCSASLQNIVKNYKAKHGNDFSKFSSDYAIQLNDTHPVIAIPELIRLLEAEGIDFETAFDIAQKTFNYTNHTVLGEALEKWDINLINDVIPNVFQYIQRIQEHMDRDFDQRNIHGDMRNKMRIIDGNLVHMARLAVYVSTHTNGVAWIHTEILKDDVFKEWYQVYPERFQNKTNGITQRRWLGLCNPELSKFITDRVGEGWLRDLDKLTALNDKIDDKAIAEFNAIKDLKKQQLSDFIQKHDNVYIDPSFIFDVQVKRLHEYKRQLLNILHVIYLYNQIKMHPEMEFYPRTFIFGAKASAGYATAKKIIKLINSVADVVNNDASINGKIKVVFIENYRVSNAEWIFAAADVSEQISTASKEASGTGNMKFMLNGAPTLGTMDGANVEIVEEVGAENAFIFGLSSDEVINYENNGGYDPNVIYNTDEEIRQVLMQLINGTFSNDTELFRDLYDSLLNTKNTDRADRYFILADFRSYADAQKRVEAAYRDEKGWAKKALLNTACSGKFTSDRTIQEYVDDIWHLDKVIVRKK